MSGRAQRVTALERRHATRRGPWAIFRDLVEPELFDRLGAHGLSALDYDELAELERVLLEAMATDEAGAS